MIGQENILKVLEEMESVSDQQFYIIIGPVGHGKKTLAKEIARVKNANFYLVQNSGVESIRNMMTEAQRRDEPTLYCIDGNQMLNQFTQNALLKFAEEPPKNAFLVVTTTERGNLFSTLRARATSIPMLPYTLDDLKKFSDDCYLTSICDSPGQILRFSGIDITEAKELVNRVVENIHLISTANVFNIYRHFEEIFMDKENMDLFMIMLLAEYENFNKNVADVHLEVRNIYNYKRTSTIRGIAKKSLFESMLLSTHEIAKGTPRKEHNYGK